jgi:hypothetical protein
MFTSLKNLRAVNTSTFVSLGQDRSIVIYVDIIGLVCLTCGDAICKVNLMKIT